MVGHTGALFGGGLRGADIETAIHLRGVAGDHFAAELLREPHAQRGFSRGGGADDGDEGRFRSNVHWGRSNGQARSSSSASTIDASRTLPITSCRESFMCV